MKKPLINATFFDVQEDSQELGKKAAIEGEQLTRGSSLRARNDETGKQAKNFLKEDKCKKHGLWRCDRKQIKHM